MVSLAKRPARAVPLTFTPMSPAIVSEINNVPHRRIVVTATIVVGRGVPRWFRPVMGRLARWLRIGSVVAIEGVGSPPVKFDPWHRSEN